MGAPRESILQSQAALVGTQFLRLGLGFAATFALARGLDDAGWASFMLLSTACALATQLVDAGLQPALVAELATGSSRKGLFFRRVMGVRWIIALVLLVPALWAPTILPDPLPLGLFVLVLLTLPFRGWNAVFAAARRNRVTAFGGLVIHVLFVLAVLALVAMLGSGALASILVLLVLRELALSLYPVLRLKFDEPHMVVGGRESREPPQKLALLALASVFGAAYLHIDVFMLEAMRGPEAVAAYGLATRLLLPVMVGANLLAAPYLPFLARGPVTGRTAAGSDLTIVAASLLGAVLPAVFCFAAAAPLIELLRGAPRPLAAEALQILAPVPLAVAFGSVLSIALIVARRYAAWALITAFGFALNIGLNWYWIPEQGPAGAARATLITEIAVALLAGLVIVFGPRRSGAFRPRSALFALVLACVPTLPLVLLRFAHGPITTRGSFLVVAALAFALALAFTLFGPPRRIRAHFERADEEGRA